MIKVVKYLLIGSCFLFFIIGNSTAKAEGEYNAKDFALHHIADANTWHIVGNVAIPLPIIVYHPKKGLDMFMSSKLPVMHTTEEVAQPDDFTEGSHEEMHMQVTDENEAPHVTQDYKGYILLHDRVATADGSKFYDLSITKNVATLLITCVIMLIIFISVANAYKRNTGKAPSGLQSLMEPIILFVREDVVRPNLGDETDRFLPYMLTLFFFIWIANILGLIPFISNPNLTGNITITMALSLMTFVITNVNGTKDYWKHIFWPPGVPLGVKLILVPIEILGIFIKPFALMIRLFANITAGHIIVLSLIGLVFTFGKAGESFAGGMMGAAIAVPFAIFMS
ncbi:MAG TPA: F0F1 ATP synthase subunit A, partial [Chitinophagales bacterium]|nr:F0F1 ATP synthase subunit A [Chitinophagales bacterium]